MEKKKGSNIAARKAMTVRVEIMEAVIIVKEIGCIARILEKRAHKRQYRNGIAWMEGEFFMQKIELEKVGIYDVEKLIRLADDVVRQVECNIYLYDRNGMSIYRQVEEIKGSFEEALALERGERHREECDEIMRLIRQMIREEHSFNKVYYDEISDLRENIEPLKSRIIGIFRNGAEQDTVTNETNYCADETVSDEYLMNLFTMRIRDRRIIMAAQRFPKRYFLLLRGYPSIHDGDEYVGIYMDIGKLRKAYETEQEKLNKEKEEYPCDLTLQIYEFDEEKYETSEFQGKLVTPEEIWGTGC